MLKQTKRLFSFLLALIMVLSMVPGNAFEVFAAEGTETAARDYSICPCGCGKKLGDITWTTISTWSGKKTTDGAHYRVVPANGAKTLEASSQITIGGTDADRTIVIDLNGVTVTRENGRTLLVYDKLVLLDSSATADNPHGNGGLIGGGNSNGGVAQVFTGGSLIVYGGNYSIQEDADPIGGLFWTSGIKAMEFYGGRFVGGKSSDSTRYASIFYSNTSSVSVVIGGDAELIPGEATGTGYNHSIAAANLTIEGNAKIYGGVTASKKLTLRGTPTVNMADAAKYTEFVPTYSIRNATEVDVTGLTGGKVYITPNNSMAITGDAATLINKGVLCCDTANKVLAPGTGKLVAADVAAEYCAKGHSWTDHEGEYKACTLPILQWVDWTSATSLPKQGNYRLTQKVTTTAQTATTGELNLDLNGFDITRTVSTNASTSANVYLSKTSLTLTDTPALLTNAKPGTVRVEFAEGVTCSSTFGTVLYANGGKMNIHAGVIDGSNVDYYRSADKDGTSANAAVMAGTGATVSVHGGTIYGHKRCTAEGYTVNTMGSALGGWRGTAIVISGGEIIGGSAAYGGAIGTTGDLTITGGTISSGSATETGKGIYVNSLNADVTIGGNAIIEDLYLGDVNSATLSGAPQLGNVILGSEFTKLFDATKLTTGEEGAKITIGMNGTLTRAFAQVANEEQKNCFQSVTAGYHMAYTAPTGDATYGTVNRCKDNFDYVDQENGTHIETCQTCGDTRGEAAAHELGQWAENEAKHERSCVCGYEETEAHKCALWTPDAENANVHSGTCSVCNAVMSEAHTEEAIPAVDPTCTSIGYTAGVKCSECNAVITAPQPVDALQHNYVESITKVATCKEEGEKTFTCSCGDTYTQPIAKLEHTEETIPAVDPTCTEVGWTAGVKCSKCDAVITPPSPIGALDHDWDEGTEYPKHSCTVDGIMTYRCTRDGCKESYTKTVSQTGHTEETIPAVAPTCTSIGYTAGVKCSVCDAVITAPTPVDALGHSYNESVEAATCQKEGKKTFTCACGDTYTEAIAKLEHTKVAIPAVAPSCTETGWTAGVKCSVCETVLTAPTQVDALGHTEETVAGYAATCTETGLTEGKKCTVCGVTTVAQTVVDALGHTEETVAGKDATCTETGLTEGKKCSVCGEITVAQTEIAALGHTEETVAGKAATCTETGLTEGKKCKVCGVTTVTQTEIPALGHTKGTAVKENEVAASCGADGSYDEVVYCSVCEAEISREKKAVPATGAHVYATETEKVDATCTDDGYVIKACGCGAEETTVIKAEGHKAGTAVKENEVAATCGADGSYDEVVYCSVCGAELSRKTETVSATGAHVYATETEKVDATCTDDGYVIMACGCGATEKTVIKAKGHTAAEAVKENEKPATCAEDGSYDMVVYCSVCGGKLSSETTTVKAEGHKAGETVKENEVAASCGKDGSYDEVVYCSVCEAEISREKKAVPATGAHVYATETERVEATCTADGYVVKACACGATEKTTLTSEGHKAGKTVKENEVAAECEKDGSYDEVVYCSVCNTELSRKTTTVGAKGHTEQTMMGKEPTCTETGLSSYVRCVTCNKPLTEQTVIPAKGHTKAEAVKENEKPATCGADGSYDEVVYCSVCDAEISREKKAVSATGEHKWGYTHTDPKATCTTPGMDFYRCDSCGTTEGRKVDAKGHTAAEAVKENEVAATCGADGSYDEVVYCSVCGAELSRKTETVPATGEHVYATEKEKVDATCTDDGYVIMACGCGATEKTVIKAKGHTAAEAVKENEKSATCTEDGSYDMVVYCSVCGGKLSSETTTVKAEGHKAGTAVKENETAPGCETAGGYDEVVYCSVCGAELSRKTETVPAKEHSFEYTNNGDEHTVTCTNGCGETKTEAHAYDEDGKCVCGAIEVVKVFVAEVGTEQFETLAAAIAAANGKTVKLLENVELTETLKIPYGTTMVLDLNGKTISQVKNQTTGYSMIENDGVLTIMTSQVGGKISYTDSGNGGNYVSNTITNRGTITVQSGTIENLSSKTVGNNGYPYVIDSSIWGQADKVETNITGGKLYSEGYSAIRLRADSATEAVDVNVTGGEIVGTIEVQLPSGSVAGKGTLNITGGQIKNNATSNALFVFGSNGTASNLDVNISGGNITGNVTVRDSVGADFDKGIITGGTFTTDVTALCAEGFKAEKNGDVYGIVEKKDFVAKINGVGYESVAAALDAAYAAGMKDVVITLVGETTASTTDSVDLYNKYGSGTAFNTITFKQEDASKAYYLNSLYTGWTTGKVVFDGVNIKVTYQLYAIGKVELINNAIITRTNDVKNFVFNGDMTIEPGSKFISQIDGISSGSSLTVDGGRTDGSFNTAADYKTVWLYVDAGNTMTIKNGAYVVASNYEYTELALNGTLNMQASRLDVFTAVIIGANGVLNIDANSVINTKKITGSGKIVVDATGMTEGTVEALKNVNASGFTGTIELANAGNMEAVIEGGKIVLKAKAGLAGSGTEADPFLIETVDDLIFFRDSVNAGETKYSAPGVCVALGADIDLAGENWVGIGSIDRDHGFMGNFDGKGFKIKNLTITNPTLATGGYAYAGLFSITEGTDENNQNVIENLIIENVTISTTGDIVAAAIAYPYYTTVENVTVCGDINITGGNYTAGALAYTRRCVNASDVTVSGNAGSYITGKITVGGVISDIQTNGGLTANYSNFSASGLTITGEKSVGGISGIICKQTLKGATVKDVTLVCDNATVGTVAGSWGDVSTITNVVVENVTGATAVIGATYKDSKPVQAKIGDTYYATFAEAVKVAFAAAYANNGAKQTVHTANGEVYATLGTWGGIDWTLTADGTLTIAPTKGTPVADKNAPTKRTYQVGEWRETVVYKSNGSASSIGGQPYDMKAVKKLIIEEGVTKIGSFTCQFPNLTGEVVIPSTVTYIGQEAFHKAPITKLIFAEGENAAEKLCIANGAFKKILIEEVALPKDRKEIHVHHWAFGGCPNLKSAFIPACGTKFWGGEHVDYFDNFNAQTNVSWTESSSIFTGCTNMETITFENEAVRDLFFAKNRQSTAEDYIVAYIGLTAYNNLQTAINAAQNGETVKLIKNVALTATVTVPAGKTVTLDLNGKTISQTKACTASYEMINNKGNLTITGNGVISLKDTGAGDPTFGWGSYTVRNEGNLTVENGTIKFEGTQAFGTHCSQAIFQYSGSTTINGGKIINNAYRSVRLWKGDMTINGGTFEGQVWVQCVDNSAKLTINGGSFAPATSGDASSVFVSNAGKTAELSVTGGTFNGKIGANDAAALAGAITGGQFSETAKNNTPAALYKGYAFSGETDADGYYTLEKLPVVAMIGTEEYATLEAAFAAVQDGETITLMADITSSEIITINKAITLDGNGKALTSTAGRAINVSGANGVTIKNLTINAKGERAINIIQNATNVAIENVTATAYNYTVNVASSAANAAVAIKDSKLTGLNVVNVAAVGADVTVTGGTLTCNDQNANENYSALALNQDAKGAKIAANGVTFDIKGESAKAKNSAENGVITIDGSDAEVKVAVAYISYGNTAYTFETLQAAIEKAQAGETIILIRDVTSSEIITINKAITLDGNGKTLTSTAGRAINVSGADGVTIKNLTINAKGERAINIIQNATNVAIENVTATAYNYTVNVASSAPNAAVAIKDSKLTGLNVVNVAAAGADVTVTGGTLTCNDQSTVENYAALNLHKDAKNGKITANGVTFDIKGDSIKASNGAAGGVITIDGSTDEVKVDVAYISYGNNYYGFTSIEAALAVAKDGETITLLKPIVVAKGETLTLDKDVNIVYTSNAVGEDMITVRGTLNVAAGKITYTNTDKTGNNVTVSTISCEPGSVLNITGGAVENKTVYSTGSYAYAIDLLTNGSLGDVTATISGGEVYSDYMAIRQFNNGTACKNSLTVTGGEIYGAKRAIQIHMDNNAAELAISGGKIEAGEDGYALCLFPTTSTNIAVSGGEFKGAIYSGTDEIISGGTFDEAVYAGYVAPGYMVTENSGIYGVVVDPAYGKVAKIGDTYFETLEAAFAAVQDGETITILAGDYTTNINVSGNITLAGETDAEGNNLVNITGKVSVGSGATVKNLNVHNTKTGDYDCALVVNGKDIVIDGVQLTGYNATRKCYATGNVTIKNSKINGSNYAIHFDGKAGGNVVIENCDITGWCAYANTLAGVSYTDCQIASENGHRYYNKNVSFTECNFADNFTLKLWDNAAYDVVLNENTYGDNFKINLTKKATVTVTDSNLTMDELKGMFTDAYRVANGNVTLNGEKATYAASVYVDGATKYFDSLQDAIDAAPNGRFITLRSNVVLDAPLTVAAGKQVTIGTMDGFTITYTSDKMGEAMITNNGDLTLDTVKVIYTYTGAADSAYAKGNYTVANNGKLTLTYGATIENNTAAMKHASYAITNGNGGQIVLDDGLIKNTNNYAVRMFGNGSLTVDGGEIIGTRAVWMQAPGSNTADAPAVSLTVNDGKLTGTGETGYKLAVYSYTYGNSLKNVSVTVNGGEIDGDIALSGGANKTAAENVTITGGVINGELYSYADDAVAGESVNVSGGTFAGPVAEAYCAEGFIPAENADGTYGVKIGAYVAQIGTKKFETLAAAFAAAKEGETVTVLAGTISEGTIKLPATLKNVTIKGEEGAILKDTTISAADGNSYSYIGLTFDGLTFDNGRILLTGWRNGEETIKDLTVTNCTFKNLYDTTSSAAVHINKDAAEAVENFTFTNNVIDGATGGSKSGVYAQVTGKTEFTGNTINNVAFRPYVIQVTTDDGIADELIVTSNTFSGSAVGRAQGLGSNASGTDTVKLVVTENIFKGITDSQQICYWNFNEETTTADLSHNYYDIDILANSTKIYFNSSAKNAADLIEMGVYPYYADEAKTELVEAPSIMVTYADGTVEYFEDMRAAVPHKTNYPKLEGATITLLKDVSGLGMRFMENGMVFDLNGHTYTLTGGTGSTGTETSGFQIRPEVTETVIIKNGSINIAEGAPIVWLFNNYATNLVVEDVTVDCTNMAWAYGSQCKVAVLRSGDNVQFTGNTKIENFNSDVAPVAYTVGGTMTIGDDVVPGGAVKLDVGTTLTARAGLDVVAVDGYSIVYADGVYSTAMNVAKIGNVGYTTLAAAIAAAKDGDTIKLLADCAETVTIQQKTGVDLTIDGMGFDYTGKIIVKGRDSGMAKETLTIQNVNFKTSVKYHVFIDATTKEVQNLTVQNCTFASTAVDANGAATHNGVVAVKINESGNVTVKDCVADPVYYLVNNTAGGRNLTIDGCTVNGFYGVRVYNNIDAVIKNSTFNTEVHAIVLDAGNSAVTTIENCNISVSKDERYPVFFNAPAGNRTVVIKGTNTFDDVNWFGGINDKAHVKVVLEDAAMAVPVGMVAQNGNTYYNFLQDAVNEAADGDIITVVADHTVNAASATLLDGTYKTMVNVAGKAVTVDLNGKKIYTDYNLNSMLVGFFSVEDGGSLTLIDSVGTGEVEVKATSTVYGLLVSFDTGKLTVEGGTYKLDAASDSLIYAAQNETVTVNGGNFTLGNIGTGANGSPWIFNVKGQNTAHVTVTGGTFNADVAHQYWTFEVQIPKTSAMKDNGDGTWTVVEAVAYVAEKEYSGNWYINEVGYATLEEAIAAAGEGETVTLLTNVTVNSDIAIDGKAITLDLNGYNVTVADEKKLSVGDELTVTGTGNITKLVLTAETAKIHAAETLNVASGVDGFRVEYADGAYYLYDNVNVAINLATGVKYADLQKAINDAYKAGGATVQLMNKVETDEINVKPNVTLDLAGWTLTAEFVTADYATTHIIDSSEGEVGLLKADYLSLNVDNSQIAVKTANGYRFFDVQMREQLTLMSDGRYRFRVGVQGYTDMTLAELMAANGMDALDIQFRVNIQWKNANGTMTSQAFRFSDALSKQYAADYVAGKNTAQTMYISGAQGLEELSFTAQLVAVDERGNEIVVINGVKSVPSAS